MGVRDKMWRLMYRAYVDFKCRVRLGNELSDWYELNCGIHQGGFLSLTKYVAFINSLIVSLETSNLCCQIHRVPASPAGYADDLAAACTTKQKTDMVMDKVNQFGCKWRFQFNAKKSAILVYGEENWERKIGNKNRFYKLGKDKVQEKLEYDHVGIKACVLEENSRVEEKLAKGRRALNATAGLGIRKNGLVVATCNLIFWTIVIPIITFGCELWSISDSDILRLQAFQRYAGRRVQRFPQRSPSSSSFFGLGWVRLETLISVKKVLFIHTLVRMINNNRLSTIFKARVLDYLKDRENGESNVHCSPIFSMLNSSKKLGLIDIVLDTICGRVRFSKSMWSKMVWEKAWETDDAYWRSTCLIFKRNDLLYSTIANPRYLVWWQLADKFPQLQKMCENMARLICRTSQLKCDDFRLKDSPIGSRICLNCNLGIEETLHHVVMQCPFVNEVRIDMFDKIDRVTGIFKNMTRAEPENTFPWIIGKSMPDIDCDIALEILMVTGYSVFNMYRMVIGARVGVG